MSIRHGLLVLVVLARYLALAQERPVLMVGVDASQRPTIEVRGEIGATYCIECKTRLDETFWFTRTPVEMRGPSVRWTDTVPLVGGGRFYRVVQVEKPAVVTIPNMVWVPPGTFVMGSPVGERNRSSNEGPQTVVTMTRGFWLGAHEVRQRDYAALIGQNPSHFTGDPDRPVERVTWLEAVAYCEKLTAVERAAGRLPVGYEYRLPTEAQWEYACRAGTTTRFFFGDALECDDECGRCALADPYVWWCANAGDTSHRVGEKAPNPWGLRDTAGNVMEWCADWYSNALPGGQLADPTGPASGFFRMVRGGGWASAGQFCRSAFRLGGRPDSRFDFVGFRVALVGVP